ncbi:MAG: antitermination regulator [Frankiales bacterium]|nr:antitermination regulator [Frankiales bacterium]
MTAPTAGDSARLFARIANELADQKDAQATTLRVVELAKSVLDCDSTAVWTLTDAGAAKMLAANDDALAREFSSLINRVREGVAWSCLHTHVTIRVDDIRTDHRWPAYRAFVISQTEKLLLSAVGYSLDLGDRNVGALVLSSTKPNYFTDEMVDIGAVFAQHAAISVDAATTMDKVANLQLAIQTNRKIGVAMGILMAEYRVTEARAFDLLRTASQHRHDKLRNVADDVVLTGSLPEWPTRRPAV